MLPSTHLTKNFSVAELQCKCGCKLTRFAPGFLQALQELRDDFGTPMPINSACRCAAHNARVGGHPRSLHVGDKPVHNTGGTCAVDVGFPLGHPQRDRLIALAEARGWSIGLNNRFVHLDRRTANARLPQGRFTYGS